MFGMNVFQDTPSTTQYLSEKHINVKGILHLNCPNSLIWKINSLPHCVPSNFIAQFVLLNFQYFVQHFILPYQSCLKYKNEEWEWVRKSLVSKSFLNCEVLCAKMECVAAAASPLYHRAAKGSYFCCHQLAVFPQKFFPLFQIHDRWILPWSLTQKYATYSKSVISRLKLLVSITASIT